MERAAAVSNSIEGGWGMCWLWVWMGKSRTRMTDMEKLRTQIVIQKVDFAATKQRWRIGTRQGQVRIRQTIINNGGGCNQWHDNEFLCGEMANTTPIYEDVTSHMADQIDLCCCIARQCQQVQEWLQQNPRGASCQWHVWRWGDSRGYGEPHCGSKHRWSHWELSNPRSKWHKEEHASRHHGADGRVDAFPNSDDGATSLGPIEQPTMEPNMDLSARPIMGPTLGPWMESQQRSQRYNQGWSQW